MYNNNEFNGFGNINNNDNNNNLYNDDYYQNTEYNQTYNQNFVNQYDMSQNSNVYNIDNDMNYDSSYDVNEELLKSFIGKNYDKITTRKFNVAGFFFTTFYLLYRKMFLYSLILFLVNLTFFLLINNFLVSIVIAVVVGFFVNKIYLRYASAKVEEIKSKNSYESIDSLINICSAKGGTSVGKIFLGFLCQFAITVVVLVILMLVGIGTIIGDFFSNANVEVTTNNGSEVVDDNYEETEKGNLMKDVDINGHSCASNKCNFDINGNEYSFTADNVAVFKEATEYDERITINIYFVLKDGVRSIVDYELILKSNNMDISNVKNVDELKSRLGFYPLGTHTVLLTLNKIGSSGTATENEESYDYTYYTFVDGNSFEYEMKYVDSDDSKELVEGKKYIVTFEVKEGIIDDEYFIKNIR